MAKKVLLFILCVALVFSLASCGLLHSSCDHRDADDDYKCDKCGEAHEDGAEPDEPCEECVPEDDDGDCTTEIKCTECSTVTTEAKEHDFTGSWQKDEGGHWHACENVGCNVTDTKTGHISSGAPTVEKAETCTVCEYMITPEIGHTHEYSAPNYDNENHWNECSCRDKSNVTAHVANSDDGDCTTAITCSGCEYIMTAARTAHEADVDDGDCTTAINCRHCTKVAVAGNENHAPEADDGDCTTAINCRHCTKVAVAGNENHTPEADDGDCTTAQNCAVCGGVAVAAKDHTDSAGDGLCDNCGKELNDESEITSLDGKKIIFIGNSYTYYGQTVIIKEQKYLEQYRRVGDEGFFYQLCKANGEDVNVTNWTFGGHSLGDLFDGSCAADRGCDGVDHKSYITDREYDYVVIQPTVLFERNELAKEYIDVIMSFFREANPNVKFVILVPYAEYGTISHEVGSVDKETLNALKTYANDGVIIVDWGALVLDIISGKTTVEGSNLIYNKNSFVIKKSEKDGYHPNMLSGYITTLMTYCAITGKSPADQPHDFCNNSSLNPRDVEKYPYLYNFEEFIGKYYTYNGATTNFPEVFASDVDMAGIKALVDKYLDEKPYMSYDYAEDDTPEDDTPEDDTPEDDTMTNDEAVAAGYVATLLNSGVKTYLTLDELQTKIKSGYTHGDVITLLTDVECEGATSGNMKNTKEVAVTFDLNGRTLTLTKGSLMRTTYKKGYTSTFTLISSNGKGTLTLSKGNNYAVFQTYGNNKTVTVGTSVGYEDGDVVHINAASLLCASSYYNHGGENSSFTFFGGEYNQTGDAQTSFITSMGMWVDSYEMKYFEGTIQFIGAKITQATEAEHPLFATTLKDADNIPATAGAVPGIILDSCTVSAYSASTPIHNMETLGSLITYNNCKIFGDISIIGTDTTDTGLGKVIIGEGTTFTASSTDFIKQYDEAAIGTYDGTTSGVYLASGLTAKEKDGSYVVA